MVYQVLVVDRLFWRRCVPVDQCPLVPRLTATVVVVNEGDRQAFKVCILTIRIPHKGNLPGQSLWSLSEDCM